MDRRGGDGEKGGDGGGNKNGDRDGEAVFFTGERSVETRSVEVPEPEGNEVLVEASFSAVSTGTELLLYRDEMPDEDETEAGVPGVGSLAYPTRYGYSVVGGVVAAGEEAEERVGERVHALHPHQSRFVVSGEMARRVPEDVKDEDAALLSSVETAVSFAMDGRPVVGENVAVFGQGVVGLLTTSVVSRFPVDVHVFEPREERRRLAKEMGADVARTPSEAEDVAPDGGYDISYEVSGSPDALDDAVGVTGYDGRVVVGSWYGNRRVSLDLGGKFHKSDMTVVDSQVSRLAPRFRGRWTKERRLGVAWEFVKDTVPSRLVTDSFGVNEAARAYEATEDGALCVVFDYS